jgi:alkanesulfonate monooxygenase SsuD/methylene tetrahydromethanopterin reductase-like flavin-dependent oxidoreductase (luciferase family)
MRIGISVSSSHHVEDSREGARNMIERTRAARDAGLDSLFVGDHHVTPFPYYQNNVILARMLAEWGDKPFGALYLLPLWHPVLLAEQVGTLASLAEGPFIMQCGLGDARQGEALGIDMSRKVGMFTESIRVLRTLWRGESVSENRYWKIQEARISPIPPQHVDIWVGATVDAAIERTAKLAEAWLANPGLSSNEAGEAVGRYLGYCEEHDRQPTAIAIRKDVYVGSSSEEAKATVQPYIERGYRGIAPEALLVGSSEEVAGQLRTLQGQGYTDVIVRNISTNQHECLDSIHRLAEVRTMLEG